MTGDSPAINTASNNMPFGNPRITPTADGFTFAHDAARGPAGNWHKSIRVPLTVPPLTFTDDRSVEITAHVHVTTRPEGSLEFNMYDVIPSLYVNPWNDNYSDTNMPKAPLAYASIQMTRLVLNGDPGGQPTDFSLSWLLSPAVARAWLSGPNPGIVFDYTTGASMLDYDYPAVAFVVSDIAVRTLEVAGPPPEPPAAVRYRDPADGLFKPLHHMLVNGFPTRGIP
jgi:hypothetical protein